MSEEIDKSQYFAAEPWSAFHIQTMIRDVQKMVPGWIWSLAWTCNELCVTLIPGLNSQLEIDRLLARTDRGDDGYIFTLRIESPDDAHLGPLFVKSLEPIISHVRSVLTHQFELNLIPKPDISNVITPYRVQTESDLHAFYFSYEKLIAVIDKASKHKFCIEKIYFGSCDLSVDCSVRGVDPNGSRFDIDYDIKDGNLAMSVEETITDLNSEINHFSETFKRG